MLYYPEHTLCGVNGNYIDARSHQFLNLFFRSELYRRRCPHSLFYYSDNRQIHLFLNCLYINRSVWHVFLRLAFFSRIRHHGHYVRVAERFGAKRLTRHYKTAFYSLQNFLVSQVFSSFVKYQIYYIIFPIHKNTIQNKKALF